MQSVTRPQGTPRGARAKEKPVHHRHQQDGVKNPVTRAEWQDAADAAYGALCLDSARQYGLVTGGPGVDVERCEQILRSAKSIGITPANDAAERFVEQLHRERGQ